MIRLLYPIFFLSGVAGLIYQVVWVRTFGNVFGNTIHSASLVVSVFMLGLGVGSMLAGKYADRAQPARSLWLYAMAELAIGALGLGISLLLPHFDQLAAWGSTYELSGGVHTLTWGSHAFRYAVAVVVLGPITVLMGATLTLLIRALLARDLAHAGTRVALLFGFNTAGATLGAGMADTLLVPQIGLLGAQLFAVGLNFAAATMAFALHRALRGEAAAPTPPPRSNDARADRRVLHGASLSLFLSGLSAMGLEIVWFRLLSSIYGQTRLVFSLLMVAMLGAMWLGSLVGAWALERGVRPPNLMVAAQAGFATLAVLGAFSFQWATDTFHPGLLPAAGWVVVLPSICLGLLYPAANALVQHEEASVGQRSGFLYLANTLGNVLGVLLAGFVLLPAVGMQLSLINLAAVALVSTLPIYLRCRQEQPTLRVLFPWAAGLGAASLVLATFVPADQLFWLAFRAARDSGGATVAATEGLTESMVVTQAGSGSRTLWTNGHSMSGTSWSAQRYMRAMAHVPLLLSTGPQKVLLICFGVGNTADAIAQHPSVERLDVVDLSKDVLAQAGLFAATNEDVLKDPRVQIFVNDGRHHLLMQPQGSYDLVTLEPPPINQAGMASLYSRDFYALVRSRLKPGGFVTQWLPAYQVGFETNLALTRAFLEVFPHTVLLVGYAQELILMGFNGPLVPLDLDRVKAAVATAPRLQAGLEKVYLGSSVELAGLFASGPAALAEATKGVTPVTDDFPLLEYDHPSRGQTRLPAALFRSQELLTWCPQCRDLAGLSAYRAVLEELYASKPFLGSGDEPMVAWPYGFPSSSDAARTEVLASSGFLAMSFASAPALKQRGRWLTGTGHLAEAARLFDRASLIAPDDGEARRLLAEALDSLGERAQADAVRRRVDR